MPAYQQADFSIPEVLDAIDDGRIQLPEFQRGFDWKAKNRRELLDSIQRLYPCGTILMLSVDPEKGPPFGTRPIAGAPTHPPSRARYLILDGQQRITTIYQALRAQQDRITALRVKDAYENWKSGSSATFGDLLAAPNRPNQPMLLLHNRHLLPLEFLALRDPEQPNASRLLLRSRLIEYRRNLPDDDDSKALADFVETHLEAYLDGFLSYTFPCVVLDASLDIEAVCNVFTKINTTGRQLSAFDLCVATLYPQDVNLRQLLRDARATDGFTLVDKDGTNALQTVALLAGEKPKKNSLPDTITKQMLATHWANVVAGLGKASQALQRIGAWDHGSMPYDSIVPPLAATLVRKPQAASTVQTQADTKAKVGRWVHQSALVGRYSEGTDVKQVSDFPLVESWLGGGQLPIFLDDPVVWTQATSDVRGGAKAKAFLLLLNERRPLDWLTGDPVGRGAGREPSDLHHIFPRAYLEGLGYEKRHINRTLNLTFLAPETNRFISDKSPGTYLKGLIERAQTAGASASQAEATVRERLSRHLIDNPQFDAMLANDFNGFIAARSARIREVLSAECGITFVTGSEGDDVLDDDEELDELDEEA